MKIPNKPPWNMAVFSMAEDYNINVTCPLRVS